MEIALALLLAKLLGTALEKMQIPAVLGGVFAGVILGVSSIFFLDHGINFLGDIHSEPFKVLGEIGIVFLLFMSGMEVNMGEMKKAGTPSIMAAIGGVTVPFMFGIIFGMIFHYPIQEMLVIASILTATSVGITARTLMDMNLLRKRSSTVILSASVIDDIMGIIILTLVLGTMDIGELALRIAAFFFVTTYLGMRVIGKIMNFGEKISVAKGLVAVGISLCFVYSAFAEEMGIAAITGAFLAGLLVGNSLQARVIKAEIHTIATAFFVPLFFVTVGVSFEMEYFKEIGISAVVFVILALAGKIIGSGLGAKGGGLSWRESLQVGIGMMARLEVALVIAAAAIGRGVLTEEGGHRILALTVLLVIVSTIITPLATKWAFKGEEVEFWE